jgi:ABC-type branched-subunit amino acid transport system ATPase component
MADPSIAGLFQSLREQARNKRAHLFGGEQQMLATARALVKNQWGSIQS